MLPPLSSQQARETGHYTHSPDAEAHLELTFLTFQEVGQSPEMTQPLSGRAWTRTEAAWTRGQALNCLSLDPQHLQRRGFRGPNVHCRETADGLGSYLSHQGPRPRALPSPRPSLSGPTSCGVSDSSLTRDSGRHEILTGAESHVIWPCRWSCPPDPQPPSGS